MDSLINYLSENQAMAWAMLILLFAAVIYALRKGGTVSLGKFKMSKPQQEKVEHGTATEDLKQEHGQQNQEEESRDVEQELNWETGIKDKINRGQVPEQPLGILAKKLAYKVKDLPERPDKLFAVQKSGHWLAKQLADLLPWHPTIVLVEKDIPPKRREAYLRIPVMGLKKKPDFYIAYEKLDQSKFINIVIVDDFVDTGGAILSIVNRVKAKRANVKAVATIAVGKKIIDDIQNKLRTNGVELLYIIEGEEGLDLSL